MHLNLYESRKATLKLIEVAEAGIVSWQAIAEAALGYLSEAEVSDMCDSEGFSELWQEQG